MKTFPGLCNLAYLLEEAAKVKPGTQFNAYIEGVTTKFILDGRNSYTYTGCRKFIQKEHRFFRLGIGKRRGLFLDKCNETLHNGPCSVHGRQFWRLKMIVEDEGSFIEAAIWEAAGSLFGDGVPLVAHDFAKMRKSKREELVNNRLQRRYYFEVQCSLAIDKPPTWVILNCSFMPLHKPTTLSPNQNLTQSSESEETEFVRCGPNRLDGSPNRRLLNLTPRAAFRQAAGYDYKDLVESPPSKKGRVGTDDLVACLEGLQGTVLALKQAKRLLAAAVDNLSSFLEHD